MNKYTGVEIAIIGMSGQFPGAKNINQFWDNLKDGVESISFLNEEEILAEGENKETIKNPSYVKANAYLDNKQYFDSAFFGYTPSEARLMDPQARLFHENCWKAIEDAGYDITNNTDKIGLFGGASSNVNWLTYSLFSNLDDEVNNFNAFHLRDITFMCSRVSYLLNLQGPSVYINTACSTSLVAIQRACMSLLLRECKMALAGGVTVKNYSKKGYIHQEGMVDSSDGHCRTFDADADGTIGGEGVGVIVLKRLSDAIKDGDNIYAIVKGSGVNNDGANKIAYTAPSIDGQSQAILKAISMAKIEPQSISYVEAHGTATKLGDPAEIEALTHSFGESKDKYCAIGSVKTNVGHLDIAAGVAGFIKTALSLKNKKILPSLNFKTPNPKINFLKSPFYVNTTLKEWKNSKYPLRAGVSSFGIGGTNAHAILEEPPKRNPSSESREYQILNFSAKTVTALERKRQQLLEFIKEDNTLKLSDIAYTLQTGRASFGYRKAVVCKDKESAVEELLKLKIEETDKPLSENVKPSVVFMFSGQGSQYREMCLDLYKSEAVFRETLDKCFNILKNFTDKDLKQVLFIQNTAEINNTENAQPLLFIIEYALAQLLSSWGVHPDIMVGHSIGEYVAACLSGVFSLEDALLVVLKRGEIMQKASRGSMLSVSISKNKIVPYIHQNKAISLAAVNSSGLCVLSGENEDIEEIKSVLEENEYPCKILKTSHAFHSHMMDEVLDNFKAVFEKIELNIPEKAFYSNVTGELIDKNLVITPNYWVKHLRGTVMFSKCIENITKNRHAFFIEVGPGKALSSLVKSHKTRNKNHRVLNMVRNFHEEENDQQYLLKCLGNMWEYGVKPDWKAFYKKEIRQKVSLPTYPFAKVEYPVNVDAYKMLKGISGESNKNNDSWYYEPSWKKVSLLNNSKIEDKSKVTMLFLDELGIGNSLLEKFKKDDASVICVKKGKEFHIDDSGVYHINPEVKENIEQLFADLDQKNINPDRMLYAWSILNQNYDTSLEYKIEETNFFTLLNIVKSFNNYSSLDEKELVVVTNDLHAIVGNEEGNFEEGMQLGLLKVIAQEYSGIVTGHIDISVKSKDSREDIEKLYEEILHKETGKSIAIRNGYRWSQVYEPIDIKNKEVYEEFKNEGTYLITGGLGNLGYVLSKYLLENFNAKVILIGRTILPERKEWQRILDNEEANENLKTRIHRYLELEKVNNNIAYYSCNIIDKISLDNLILKIEEDNLINGVIHAAGVIHGSSINLIKHLETQDFEEQFFAKTIGIKALEDVFKNRELDFCLIVSSLSSILGGLGFAAYASANSFMDYFVKNKLSNGNLKNWLSVNFDGLNFSDSQLDENNLNINEIYEVIEKTLSVKHLQQIVISKTNLQLRIDNWIKLNPEESFNEDEKIVKTGLQSSNVSLTAMEQGLISLWENFFGKEIEVEDNFFDIGGDSLKALTMLRRIHKVFNVELTIKEFFDCGTVVRICECISNKKGELKNNTQEYVSIPKAELNEYYQLSSVQKRLYFLHEYAKESLAYNLPQIVNLKGVLDINRFTLAFEKLIERHESLRTSFSSIDGVPMQKIEEVDFKLEELDDTEELSKVIHNFIRPFNLHEAPLLRICLKKVNENEHILMVDMHHIITDGISQGILIADFMKLYNNEQLTPLEYQYKDYAFWQHTEERKGHIDQQKEFWLQQFSKNITHSELPSYFERPKESSHKGGVIKVILEEKEINGLVKLTKKEKATNYMVLLAVYNIFLSKLSNTEDIIVGSPVAGRQHADFDSVIGMFANTLPIRNYPKGNYTFREFLLEVKQNAIACFDNQDYPYEELIGELKIERTKGRNPLFDTMFEYQISTEESQLKIPDLELSILNEVEEKILEVSKFDFLLSVVENQKSQEGLTLKLQYSHDLFKHSTVTRFIKYYKNIINQVLENPDCKISNIELLDDKEKQEQLELLNNTKTQYKKRDTVIENFEKQALSNPDATALQCDSLLMKYVELQEKSNEIYGYLSDEIKIKKGDVIGILLDRDEYLLPSILGTLKTGAIFVPIDLKLPAERIHTIIEESNLKSIITSNKYPVEELPVNVNVINLDTITNELSAFKKPYVNYSVNSTDIAYIIFTSGSTGKPKGVMISHQSLTNYSNWAAKMYVNNEKSTFGLFTSISFDLTITSIFTPLITGNKIIAYPEVENDILVEKVFLENEINIIKLTPSHLKIIKNSECSKANTTHKKLIVGGENFESSLAKSIEEQFSGNIIQYNEYGPTEATVGCMIYTFNSTEKTNSIPIGKPIDNTKVYILDKYLNPVAKGVEGELFIAGDGVSEGYFKKKELTNEKFIENPFSVGEKMYQTGDIVKQLEDGNLIYKRRIDDQVKIRGHRIELGEIVAQIETYEFINEACVVVKKEQEEQKLLSYYIAEKEITPSELQAYLETKLPAYMVPSNFMQLEKIPLTKNGKIDKKALPDTYVNSDYIAPSNELEKQITAIFAKVLKIDEEVISITKSFFELGGNSIRVILLISSIKKLNGVKISLKNVFDNPSVQQLTKVIEMASVKEDQNIPSLSKKDYYVTSPAQERMYYQQSLDINNLGWNISAAIEISEESSKEKLEATFQKLINHHECLRTKFLLHESGVVQEIEEEVSFELQYIEESDFLNKEDAFSSFIRPFDLSVTSLFRCALLKRKTNSDLLFIDVHHIVCDGTSLNILIKDFTSLYFEEELETNTTRYIDYASWQRNSELKIEKQKIYWNNKLKGKLPRLELPTLKDRNEVNPFHVDMERLKVTGDLYDKMKTKIKEAKVSNFMFLLSIYYLLLSKVANKSDVIIGTDVQGRTHDSLKNVVGTFVNILPLRLDVNPKISYTQFLEEVKKCVLEGFENQDYQFDKMVTLINDEERTKRNPIVDVHFAVSDTVEGDEELETLKFNPILINKEVRTSPYEFKIEVSQVNNELYIDFIYSNELYDKEMIIVLKGYYANMLNTILEEKAIDIEGISLEQQVMDFSFK